MSPFFHLQERAKNETDDTASNTSWNDQQQSLASDERNQNQGKVSDVRQGKGGSRNMSDQNSRGSAGGGLPSVRSPNSSANGRENKGGGGRNGALPTIQNGRK